MAYIQRGIGERGYVQVNNGFRYHRHRVQLSSIIWRCWGRIRYSCEARLKTNVFDVTSQAPRINVIQVWYIWYYCNALTY